MNEQNYVQVQGIYSKGFGLVGKLVMQDQRLSRDAKCIYSYLCSFAGNGLTAFPSISKVCFDLKFGSKNTFRKHMKLLKDCDYVRVEQQKDSGKFARNVYTIVLEPNPTVAQNLGDGNLPHGKICTTNKNNNKSFNKNKGYYVSPAKFDINKPIENKNNFKQRDYEDDMFNSFYSNSNK